MGNGNIMKRINLLEDHVKNFIRIELMEEIMEKTAYDEDEVFNLLSRFRALDPDEINFSISISKLKNLAEFKHNPYKELFLHSISVYKIIYDYMLMNKISNNRHEFEVGSLYIERWDEVGKDENEKNSQYSLNYKYILRIEDDKEIANTLDVIDFRLFCLIINEFNNKKTMDQKFKLCFNLFDINKDGNICYKDLKNYFTIFFKDYDLENKNNVIQNLALTILSEYKSSDFKAHFIDLNNFQKVLWSANFISNLTIEP